MAFGVHSPGHVLPDRTSDSIHLRSVRVLWHGDGESVSCISLHLCSKLHWTPELTWVDPSGTYPSESCGRWRWHCMKFTRVLQRCDVESNFAFRSTSAPSIIQVSLHLDQSELTFGVHPSRRPSETCVHDICMRFAQVLWQCDGMSVYCISLHLCRKRLRECLSIWAQPDWPLEFTLLNVCRMTFFAGDAHLLDDLSQRNKCLKITVHCPWWSICGIETSAAVTNRTSTDS